jgi:excinuclease ABC subunit B
VYERDYVTVDLPEAAEETFASTAQVEQRIAELDKQMKEAARRLDFEQAAELRDRIRSLRKLQTA